MTRQEFIEKLTEIDPEIGQNTDHELSNEDYITIEMVYTYHPVIRDSCGKKQIAHIYAYGGMGVIRDMVPTAAKARQIEVELREVQAKKRNLIAQLEALRTGKEAEEVMME